MTYLETLDWMFTQLPMYQEKGKSAFNGKLDNIKSLAFHLKNPHKKFKSIHVAGTNGKGSSSHMLASVLQEAEYKVGLYTSPHLKDFRERIRINGEPVSETYVVNFVKENQSFFEENKLSFFEMTVGMAFAYFEKEKVDIAIVEVGLGGRLDSTNIIKPEASLITNIGLDHTDMLGDTLPKIAFEKAGIIKENIPVVISEYQEETANVFNDIAKKNNAEIIFASTLDTKEYITDLLGSYQTKNIKGVVTLLKVLKTFKVTEENIEQGLKNVVGNTGLLGRWQVLGSKPLLVCDTAHNQEGLKLVVDQIKKQNYTDLHIVLGFVKNKKLETVLPLFPKNAKYYFCMPNIFRGLNEGDLKSKAKLFDLNGSVYNSVSEALNTAKKNAKESDFIFVGGSNFVVAEIV
ncbi:folylpolyglutamate synthase/dihydrofolate synthase family protein [uncultured Maribacter sp.]|uniref:bifunctional folylpolyglutamate synthase/dihydrofolate synthase n=1 Tax=uncultured Maribacter sp. TaxID=431308 RepID=UPI002630E58B|nr:folylpolyglutamate synthase/dihydrofolate synthase family protein [uncultured Maribacter sp.]